MTMPMTMLGEEDFLTRLVLEGEGYISARGSAAVLSRMAALADQGQLLPFGELAVTLGYVLPADLAYAQHLLGQLRAAPGGRRPVGYYVLARRYAKPTQVLEALEEQLQLGGRLGEIMVRNGWLTEAQVEECLALQRGRVAAKIA